MASSLYKRVSRKRACRICGKTDWCSYTPDEKISFCARENKDSDRTSRTGWGVFYHNKTLLTNRVEPPFVTRRLKQPTSPEQLAPIEIRDFVYRKIIALAPATDSDEIINGGKGLRTRNILDYEINGALPQTRSDRRELAKIIRNAVNRQFPDYVRKQKSAMSGLPGFWLDERGEVQLWTKKDYACPLMLIPYRDADGLIQACQIRFMCRRLAGELPRYLWLSTPEKSNGASCGSPLHFAAYNPRAFHKPLLITEGALKAATTRIFKGECDVLASAGVSCSHEEIIAAARFRPLLIAFDADYYENFHVARAVARLLDWLQADAVELKFHLRVKILMWKPEYKGIDDALLQNIPITPKSPREWFKSLSSNCQRETAFVLPITGNLFGR